MSNLASPVRPLVAVTATSGAAGRHQTQTAMLGAAYVRAVEAPGAAAVLLTPFHTFDAIDAIMDAVHGLVLTGGEDVDPARYAQPPHPALGTINPARDEAELRAFARARERGLPVLAICRGVQLLNVALGGTLIQDLPSERPGPLVHEQEAPVGQGWHHADVESGSELARVFGSETLFINSFHHQAIDRVAPGLRPTVWSPDGIVEGVEMLDGERWICGVQWHPERGEAETPADQRDPNGRLFWEFARRAADYARRAAPSNPDRGEVADLV